MERLFFRIREVAEMTALGRSKTYELVQQRRIGSVRVDGRLLVPASALAEFTASLEFANRSESAT